MAFNTYLVDTVLIVMVTLLDIGVLPILPLISLQSMSVQTTGRMTEASVGIGVNLQTSVFRGSIGIPFLKYNRESRYKEEDDGNYISYFNYFTASETLNTEGRHKCKVGNHLSAN